MPALDSVPPLSSIASHPADVAGIAGEPLVSSVFGRFSRFALLLSKEVVGNGDACGVSVVTGGSWTAGGVLIWSVTGVGGGTGVLSVMAGVVSGVLAAALAVSAVSSLSALAAAVVVTSVAVSVVASDAFTLIDAISFARALTLDGNGNS